MFINSAPLYDCVAASAGDWFYSEKILFAFYVFASILILNQTFDQHLTPYE
jgi:hypothetical protein